LTKLNLSFNDLKSIKGMRILKNLTFLDLSYNILRRLSKVIGNLINLIYLNLQNDLLRELPKEIGNLINLKYWNLYHNYLVELPK